VRFFTFNNTHFHNNYNQKPRHNHQDQFQEQHIHPEYNLFYNYRVKTTIETIVAKHPKNPKRQGGATNLPFLLLFF
jgi:hypothetical protein